ncbi:MAG: RidA family protein [Planctomycetota bacterium]|jgi:2-iminobutanoate/2-iminopropanoate deaminase|nr:RidA family protein [Planctomycetota bacterium]MDP7130379.1 RidA family protein [Planctomycetota bacterium]
MPEKTPFFHGPRPSSDKFPNAVRVGELVFTSGNVAFDENGDVFAPGDCAAQAELVFSRLSQLLEKAGSSMKHVIKINAHISDPADYAAYNEIRHRWFSEEPPASATVVSQFVKEGLAIEIEAIAMVTGD